LLQHEPKPLSGHVAFVGDAGPQEPSVEGGAGVLDGNRDEETWVEEWVV
jgi:hypothetical protein